MHYCRENFFSTDTLIFLSFCFCQYWVKETLDDADLLIFDILKWTDICAYMCIFAAVFSFKSNQSFMDIKRKCVEKDSCKQKMS